MNAKAYFRKWNKEHRAYKREWMRRKRAGQKTEELKIYQNKPETKKPPPTRERYPILHTPRPKSYATYLREWKARQPKWDREAARELLRQEIAKSKGVDNSLYF